MAKNKKQRNLSSLSPTELLEYTRKLRSEKADMKTQIAMLTESERDLRAKNAELADRIYESEIQVAQLQGQLDTAVENNSKLQGILESASVDDDSDGLSDSLGERIIARLDVLITLNGGDPPVDSNDMTDDDEDEEDEEDKEVPILRIPNRETPASNLPDASDFAEETDEDEDDNLDEPHEEEEDEDLEALVVDPVIEPISEVVETDPTSSEQTDAVVEIAADAIEAEAAASEPAADGSAPVEVSEDVLTNLVVPAIRETVNSFPAYEDTILAPVRDGNLSKELALRQLVSVAYPDAPDMAETILMSQTTRDAVYEEMGL